MIEPYISIVMTYYERLGQVRNTLRSFELHGYKNIEVIIVDDVSAREPLDASMFASFPFSVRILKMSPKKRYLNPCVPFNIGIRAASGKIIILQNAECLHVSDIVEHARKHVNDKNYITYACYSLGELKTKCLIEHDKDWDLDGLDKLITAEGEAVDNGADGWYNHSIYRPSAYHFCSAILKSNMDKLGGFDEIYAKGIGCDDNELLVRIRRMDLKVIIVDDHIVLHQWHYGAKKRRWLSIPAARNALLYRLVTMKEGRFSPSNRRPLYSIVAFIMPFLIFGCLIWNTILTRKLTFSYNILAARKVPRNG